MESIKFVIDLIKRILNRLFNLKSTISSFEKFANFLTIDKSTILLEGSNVRFDIVDNLEKRKYITIGEKGLIRANFIFESNKGEIVIGNNVQLSQVTFISRNRIEIKDDVSIAWGVTIYDHNSHSVNWEERKYDNLQGYEDYLNYNGISVVNKNWNCVVDKEICIESKVWIGFDATILKGVTIGEGAIVGAKSVVTKDVEPWTIVAGNPAKIIKYLPEYYK